MPICTVAPSGTRSATNSATAFSTWPGSSGGCSYGGTSTSTAMSMSSTCTKLSPSVRGMDWLICAMTAVADRTAARVPSTDVPSEQNP
jgi:hypothetical protein